MDKNKKIKAANVAFHTALADTYNEEQPHYKQENSTRIKRIIADLAAKTDVKSLLDLGCGTGYVMDLGRDSFDYMTGVDFTMPMLKQVGLDERTDAILADTELVPLKSSQFGVCTAYGFLHHLYDLAPTLKEAYRCLVPGGWFFSDQDPNAFFWQTMKDATDSGNLSGFVAREIDAVNNTDENIAAVKGITAEEVALAEYQKMHLMGFEPEKISQLFRSIGFRHAEFRYEWFLGQGHVLHQLSAQDASNVETYLRDALPVTKGLFKYVSFYAQK